MSEVFLAPLEWVRWAVTTVTAEHVLIGIVIYVLLVVPTILHAAFFKRHSRAALGWIAFIVSTPYIGAFLYVIFGVNRVRMRARKIRSRSLVALDELEELSREEQSRGRASESALEDFTEHERSMARIGRALTETPLVPRNDVRALYDGEETFPAMLDAIARATKRVWLTSYIFETNSVGMLFAEALIAAHQRGVDVRVIVDGIGQLNGGSILRPISRILRDAQVPVARFLPPRVIPPQFYINMRNHRKVLIIDGESVFTGGMNIGGRHMVLDERVRNPVQDLHFQLEGSIVRDFEWLFLKDWVFSLHYERRGRLQLPESELWQSLREERERLDQLPPAADVDGAEVVLEKPPLSFEDRTQRLVDGLRAKMANVEPSATEAPVLVSSEERARIFALMEKRHVEPRWISDVWCRLAVDGPDNTLNSLEMLIGGMIAAAEYRVYLISPYFLPTESITASLATAALRGVDVTIVVPYKSNEPLVEHAMYRSISWLIARGVRVLRQPDPFAHTKLLIVDDRYAQIGSTNLDPRSLRLNFEHVVEIYSKEFVDEMMAHYEPILAASEPLTIETVRARPWYQRTLDAFFWLFSPYL